MLKVVPAVLCLLACACGGYSDAPGIVIDDEGEDAGDGPGDEAPVGDGDGDGDGDEPPLPSGDDAGVPAEEDAGSLEEIPGANLRFASNAEFDGYLTDGEGRALYMRLDDTAGAKKTTCVGVCADQWPAYDVEEADIVAGRGIQRSDIDRFHRDDGAWQLMYKGRPLYYRAGEDGKTTVSGDAIDENGVQAYDGSARWYVARDYQSFFFWIYGVRPEGTSLDNKPFMTDGLGRTLYVYLTDTKGTATSDPVSACVSDACKAKWPVWSTAIGEEMILPSNLNASDFGSFQREDGTAQVTYRGWPLYYFDADLVGKAAGHNQGEWTVIDPMGFGIGTP